MEEPLVFKLVLVVDERLEIGPEVHWLLGQTPHTVILAVDSPERAIDLAHSVRPTLVLSSLPAERTEQLIDAFHQDPELCRVPVFALSHGPSCGPSYGGTFLAEGRWVDGVRLVRP